MLRKTLLWTSEKLDALGAYQFPLLSLLLAVLAYGLLIPWLGLYWDDWPLSWNSYHFGPQVYQDFVAYRPLSGWVYSFSFSLLGNNLIAWHLFALVWRWLSSLAFYWVFCLLWPKGKHLAAVSALLFLLYPGFSQQSIAVTYSVYFLYYTLFLCSLALMILALRGGPRAAVYTLGSLLLGLVSMLCTEYFYGLELLRPLLIGLVIRPRTKKEWQAGALAWLPYLLLLAGVFVWRNWASQQEGALYGAVLLDKIAADPLPALLEWAPGALRNLAEGGILAWTRVAEAWSDLRLTAGASIFYMALVPAAAGLSALAVWRAAKTSTEAEQSKASIILSLVALAVAGISFWVASLPMSLAFPSDRFTIPMMFGASLLLAGLWGLLRIHFAVKAASLAVLLGLCVGFHFHTANQYRAEWLHLEDFARQLAWRVPYLAPNTVIVAPQLRAFNFNTDNSLTGLLNWMYAEPDGGDGRLDYAFLYAGLRGQTRLRGLQTGEPLYSPFDFVDYTGTTNDVLMVTFAYQPPTCLRVLDPEIDQAFPELSSEVKPVLHHSHPERILASPAPIQERLTYWGLEPLETWCYYFQKADLARQFQNWDEVVALGARAFELSEPPKHPAERTPFIEGYAMRGDTSRALALTEDSLREMPLMKPMLCGLWTRLASSGADGVQDAFALLGCE